MTSVSIIPISSLSRCADDTFFTVFLPLQLLTRHSNDLHHIITWPCGSKYTDPLSRDFHRRDSEHLLVSPHPGHQLEHLVRESTAGTQQLHVHQAWDISLTPLHPDSCALSPEQNSWRLGGDHFYSINMTANVAVSEKNFENTQIVQAYCHTF